MRECSSNVLGFSAQRRQREVLTQEMEGSGGVIYEIWVIRTWNGPEADAQEGNRGVDRWESSIQQGALV